jgi:hypothetical protein
MRYFLLLCIAANVLAVISKTFVKTKEFNNGKFSKMFGCVFGEFVGKIPANVKHGKLVKIRGGGLNGIRREGQTVKRVHALNSFPKTSYNIFDLHLSALHWSNFSW